MNIEVLKVGIVACSGEEIPEGTTTRLACREVLETLRPSETVTICLPLFIAGGEEERRFAATYPTITVDGCEKRCAQRGTEKLSGKPARSLVVPEILKRKGLSPPESRRDLADADRAKAHAVAEDIAEAVDEILRG